MGSNTAEALPMRRDDDVEDVPPNYNETTVAIAKVAASVFSVAFFKTVVTEGSRTLKSTYKELRQTNDAGSFLKLLPLCCLACCTAGCLSFVLFLPFVVSIGLTVVGAMNVDHCKVQSKIPIWMIVTGCVFFVETIIKWYFDVRKKVAERRGEALTSLESKGLGCFNSVLSCFLLIWFVLGTVWVYGVDRDTLQFLDDTKATYCDNVTYWFAFAYITIVYAVLLLTIVLSLIACCVGLLFATFLNDTA